jgi:hypothetical protein
MFSSESLKELVHESSRISPVGAPAMISLAHLRLQIERSFSPLACECTISGDHSLTVKLYHPVSGQVDLVVSGLNIARLQSAESVEALIEELRYELQSNTLHYPNPTM